MSKVKYYLAYGSNLNGVQMSRRCPDAKVVGKAVIHGWKLTFRGNRRGLGVANIEPDAKSSVPVGIWKISEDDEANLDIYEGFPFLYDKKWITVTCNGKTLRTMAYIMTDGYSYAKPSASYLNTIVEGYNDFGFNAVNLLQSALDATVRSM